MSEAYVAVSFIRGLTIYSTHAVIEKKEKKIRFFTEILVKNQKFILRQK